jgi:hypothetical protein
MTLPTIKDVRETPCPKCGETDTWGPRYEQADNPALRDPQPERMRIECKSCGYSRSALPLDAEGGAK